ncbi:hypothetical protein DPX16_12461 [Anabarilius grahami]|uniref:Uncharacterized protein n=1 Tax=Anabarilius grahami TaxID=495550 RepID=A0A3N0XG77_ANAGA|nr:hypothetical protein DPX16_12461 [Anabarilius grahami]
MAQGERLRRRCRGHHSGLRLMFTQFGRGLEKCTVAYFKRSLTGNAAREGQRSGLVPLLGYLFVLVNCKPQAMIRRGRYCAGEAEEREKELERENVSGRPLLFGEAARLSGCLARLELGADVAIKEAMWQ